MLSRKSLVMCILLGSLCAFLLIGCGKQQKVPVAEVEVDEDTPIQTPLPTDTPTPTPEPTTTPLPTPIPNKTLGNVENGGRVVVLKNSTEHDIVAFYILSPEKEYEDLPDSLLTENDVFASREVRELYLPTDPEEIGLDKEDALPDVYDVLMIMDDHLEVTLHNVPFDDMDIASLLLSDTVIGYMEYFSKKTSQDISTLESEEKWLEEEQARIAAKEAEEKKAAEEAARKAAEEEEARKAAEEEAARQAEAERQQQEQQQREQQQQQQQEQENQQPSPTPTVDGDTDEEQTDAN